MLFASKKLPPFYLYLLILITTAGVLSACQTSEKKSGFAAIQMGMAKDQVIEVLGGPNVSRRWQGKDRWSYQIRDENDPSKGSVPKEIHFEQGKVVYFGEPVVPAISAEEQDQINNEHALKMEKYREEYKDLKKRARKPSAPENPPNTDPKWEKVE